MQRIEAHVTKHKNINTKNQITGDRLASTPEKKFR